MRGGIGTLTAGSGSITVPTNFGDPWQGGYYAGTYTFNGARYGLVLAGVDGEVAFTATPSQNDVWNSTMPSGLSSIDGKANTDLLIASSANNKGAVRAKQYTGGGFNDWYLASFWEWEIICRRFKPSTGSNAGSPIVTTYMGSSINPYDSTGQFWTTSFPTVSTITAFNPTGSQRLKSNSDGSNFGRYLCSDYPSNTATAGTSIPPYFRLTDMFVYDQYTAAGTWNVRPVRRVYLGTA